jgi:hypothetical protein
MSREVDRGELDIMIADRRGDTGGCVGVVAAEQDVAALGEGLEARQSRGTRCSAVSK